MELAEFLTHYRTVQLPSGPAAYADIGEGPVALFVHGLATNGAIWRHVVDEVRDRRRCIAVDLPLHGRTPGRPPSDTPLADATDFLEQLCANLGLFEIDLVAFDTGGAVAQVFAARHPERLQSLTLCNCDTHTNLPPAAFAPTVELARHGEITALAPALVADLDAARSVAFEPGFEDVTVLSDDEVRDYLLPVLGTPERSRAFEAVLSSLDAAELVAVEPELARLRVPTAIVWGTGDVFFGVEWAHWLDATVPGSTGVVELPDAKLFFVLERAGELAGVLRDHWDQGSPAAGAGLAHATPGP